MEHHSIFVSECPHKLGHLVVVRVGGDILAADNVAAYEIVVADVNNRQARVFGPDEIGELLARDALEGGDGVD